MQNTHVLYVEGSTTTSNEVTNMLVELGCSVHVADGVKKASKLVVRRLFHLVIANLERHQELSILDFIESLEGESLPIIFLSEDKNTYWYERAKQANLVAYLVSPFELVTLRSIVEYNLQQSKHLSDQSTPTRLLEDSVFIKVNQLLQRVAISDICFVKSEGNYCLIFTSEKLKSPTMIVRFGLSARQWSRISVIKSSFWPNFS
ncbi:MAG: response regulator, partial [Bacteroidota bacterium]